MLNAESTNDYYRYMRETLDNIALFIIELEEDYTVDSQLFMGRNGSTYFEEEFLKPLIRKHNEKLVEMVNDSSTVKNYHLLGINASQNVDESAERSMADMTLTIRRAADNRIYEEFINIKATSGNKNDNVGGWESLNYVLYGSIGKNIVKRSDMLDKISTTAFSTQLHDYFLWVFQKNNTMMSEIMRSSAVHSMLATSLDSFAINMSQSYPVQFNCHKARDIVFTKDYTIVDARKAFAYKILERGIIFHQKQLLSWSKAVKSMNFS